jgi:hypothetical protein
MTMHIRPTDLPSLLLSAVLLGFPLPAHAQVPPSVKDPSIAGFNPRLERRQFSLSLRQMAPSSIMAPDPSGAGLLVDLGDTTLFGRIFSGQAYFDGDWSDYPETRFRQSGEIVRGKGILPLRAYFEQGSEINANGWTDRGTSGYRLDLLRLRNGQPRHAGLYDSKVSFKKKDSLFVPVVTIIESPMIGLVQSEHPDWVVISFGADRACRGVVEVQGVGSFVGPAESERHEVRVQGLTPARTYRYRALAVEGTDTSATSWFSFRTAPSKGAGSVVFAYTGDSRTSSGGGEYEYLGVNRAVVGQLAKQMFRRGISFLLFGGDLIGGYSNSPEEFTMMLLGFRETFSAFLGSTPLYTAMGNHEALLNQYEEGGKVVLGMDKWPYNTSSAEAVFGRILLQPVNGPVAPSTMPPYSENVFSFQYGPVKIIVMNNNYWWTSHNRIAEFGGSPEGYIMPDQLEWIRGELRGAEKDPTVRYIVLVAQEPVFPNAGHASDAMWHYGNNAVRAYRVVDGKGPEPFPMGMIEVRNELWRMVSNNAKVAMVLGSDEHCYHRSLITNQTPVGDPVKDDLNRNGKLDDGVYSPDATFKFPTWFVVSGGAGAPYYTQEKTPWSGSVRKFSPQNNYILVRADTARIGIEVYSLSGQLLDEVPDLLQAKLGR